MLTDHPPKSKKLPLHHFKMSVSSLIYMFPSPPFHFRVDPYLYKLINIFMAFSSYLVRTNLQSFKSGLALFHIGHFI